MPLTLDAVGTLAALEAAVLRRRSAEVEDLLLCLHWADLHAAEPTPRPAPGGERLTGLGGEGTPRVRELALCELAIARGVHVLAARAALADALDLRHRLPLTWERVRDLQGEVWVARRVASQTRHLGVSAVALVDAAVAAVVGAETPARVLDVAAAKTIEADREQHEQRVADERRRRYVGLSRTEPATGLRTLVARIAAADAAWVDATVTRVAELLRERDDTLEPDAARADALGWLARPVQLLALLLEHGGPDDTTAATALPAHLLEAVRSLDLSLLRPRTTLYVHLHEDVLAGRAAGVARVEGSQHGGPVDLAGLQELLVGAQVTVTPVLDVAENPGSQAYEHPEALRERIHLRRPGDRFPHAVSRGRHLDLDHVEPFERGGPTDVDNTQPLSRTPHRAKTHLGYRCTVLPTGEVHWITPHGLERIVDGAGTHHLRPGEGEAWLGADPFERWLVRTTHQHRTGQLRRIPSVEELEARQPASAEPGHPPSAPESSTLPAAVFQEAQPPPSCSTQSTKSVPSPDRP